AYLYDGFVWAGYSLASFSFMLSLTKPSRLGLYNSIIQVVVSLGAILGASLGGVLIGELGFRTVFFISGAGRMLAMFFFWRMVKKADEAACREDDSEAEPQPAD
ncbi:MAG: MFS transporter, partial [Anaerolineaceae bacterium]